MRKIYILRFSRGVLATRGERKYSIESEIENTGNLEWRSGLGDGPDAVLIGLVEFERETTPSCRLVKVILRAEFRYKLGFNFSLTISLSGKQE